MINPPAISNNELRQFIEEEYGLRIQDIVFLPVGEVSYNYAITTDNHKFLFKLTNSYTLIRHQNISQFLVDFSEDTGNDQIPLPLKDKDGQLVTQFRKYYASLVPYIDGYNISNSFLNSQDTMDQISQILADIHVRTKQAAKLDFPMDSLSIDFLEEYELHFMKLQETHNRFYQQRLKELLNDQKDKILFNHEQLRKLSHSIDKDKLTYVVAHTDLHSDNIMIEEGTSKVHIIDWETVEIAPVEKDFRWFLKSPFFFRSYDSNQGSLRNIIVSREVLLFYAYRRFFEDIIDWMERISSGTNSEKQDKNDYEGIIQDCFGYEESIEIDIDNELKNLPNFVELV